MHVVRIKKILLLLLVPVLATLSILMGSVVVYADDGPVEELCAGVPYTTGLASPFSKTEGMCVGRASETQMLYQFAVKLPSAIDDVTVSAKSDDGTSIAFIKESDTLYVSMPDESYNGYSANIPLSVAECDTNDDFNTVTITAKGNSKTFTQEVSLCSYVDEFKSVVYVTANTLTGDDGAGTGKGWIEGNLGVIRDGAPKDHDAYKSTLKQSGIDSIKLSGQMNKSADAGPQSWYTLSSGKLMIPDLEPGKYTLEITYNDCAEVVKDGGQPQWTSCAIKMKFANLTVIADKGTKIGNADGSVWYKNSGSDLGVGDPSDEAETTSCAIDGVGWMICPVIKFMAEIVDDTYDLVEKLLVVEPITNTGAGSSLFEAWSYMRNIANAAFVLAFLLIIYSQITSAGISNYGIKKMLPKLVVAAILVNVSYWLCAIAVDVSNIAGGSLKSLFDSIQPLNSPQFNEGDFAENTGRGWAGIAGFILAAGAAATVTAILGVSVLLPALIAATLAIVTVFLVLTLRQALIILLIVVSPLAFVALLLPNTEEWFKKWRGLFQTLLLMFPIIAVIFGASAFASEIVMKSSGDFAVQIMGALITVLPLAITPVVMKTAGGVLNRFGGFINNPNKGPFDRMRKGAEGVRGRQQNRRAIRAMNGGRVVGGGQFRRKAKREAIDASLKRERAGLEGRYIAKEAANDDGTATGFGRKLAGAGPMGGGADVAAIERAIASASITIDKAEADEVNAASVIVRDKGKEELKGIVGSTTSSEAQRAAAMQRLVKISEPPEYMNEVNSALHGDSDLVRRATAEALSKDGPASLKASDIDRFATNTHADEQADGSMKINNLEDVIKTNVADGVLSQEKMVSETPGNLKFAFSVSDAAGRQTLQDTAIALKGNNNLNGQIKHNADAITALEHKVSP